MYKLSIILILTLQTPALRHNKKTVAMADDIRSYFAHASVCITFFNFMLQQQRLMKKHHLAGFALQKIRFAYLRCPQPSLFTAKRGCLAFSLARQPHIIFSSKHKTHSHAIHHGNKNTLLHALYNTSLLFLVLYPKQDSLLNASHQSLPAPLL